MRGFGKVGAGRSVLRLLGFGLDKVLRTGVGSPHRGPEMRGLGVVGAVRDPVVRGFEGRAFRAPRNP